MTRVPIAPKMLRWACNRAGYDVAHVAARIPQLPAWVQCERQPTLKQLEKLAKATHTPLGYLFLPEPPEERLPVPDYRTVSGARRERPSPDLLETLHTMQRRQEWLRESLVENDAESLDFVASARLGDEPDAVGREIRRALGLEADAAGVGTWQDAVRELRWRSAARRDGGDQRRGGEQQPSATERAGVRELRAYRSLRAADLRERCGCEVGTDVHARSRAHVWLGTGGLSGFESLLPGGTDVEDWCNRAAAELLAPERELRARWDQVRRA